MTDISDKSQLVIKAFLMEWWQSLSWQAQQTVAGASLAPMTGAQLYDQLLGYTLRDIAAAAEGLVSADHAGEIQDAVQTVCEWMWARPGCAAVYTIPEEWWATPLGDLVLRAHVWAMGDELITIRQAAELTGRSISSLSQLAQRGKLTRFPDPDEPNPTRATRLIRSQVDALKTKPRGKVQG